MVVLTKTYSPPPICERQIWRYAGCKSADPAMADILRACLSEVQDKLVYKVCYRELPVTVTGDVCDFGTFQLRSTQLAANLQGCHRVILFAATVGVELDRLITKYGRLSPVKALLFQAIGTERIEALCDGFCRDMAEQTGMATRLRFSPGYGDLALDAQRQLFSVLDCSRRIGVSLNDSLLMSPSKSVTAFVGVYEGEQERYKNSCGACDKQDCAFRGAI